MNNDWKPTEINEGQPTNWEPRKQHPEEVADGLRNAFRQAMKDGVMDATPYLKQMTYKSDIEKTEAEIKVLQKKLDLLKEIETHKSQSPRMEFGCGGKFEIVSYNSVDYCRYEWNDGSHKWYKRKYADEGVLMIAITDGETHRLLEGVWFNDVKKGKYDEPYCPDEPPEYDEVEWDEKDNPKPMDEVINKLIREHQAQKLRNMLKVQLDYDGMVCDDIVDIVEDWLPKEQSAEGSQNVNTELLVDGFNDCVRKMREMLR
jgi:hypothetical protein